MPSAKRRSRFPTACLSSRHEGRNSVPVAVPYHLRSFTRATRFACAKPRRSTNDSSRSPAR
jgi:hypothetical protein